MIKPRPTCKMCGKFLTQFQKEYCSRDCANASQAVKRRFRPEYSRPEPEKPPRPRRPRKVLMTDAEQVVINRNIDDKYAVKCSVKILTPEEIEAIKDTITPIKLVPRIHHAFQIREWPDMRRRYESINDLR